jgi:hypothetical protein
VPIQIARYTQPNAPFGAGGKPIKPRKSVYIILFLFAAVSFLAAIATFYAWRIGVINVPHLR